MDYNIITITNIIEDIKKARDSEAYFSALSLMFNLISKCAKLKYPTKSDEKRFIDWVNDMNNYDKNKIKTARKSESEQLPHLNCELLYKIRCAFVHDLSLDIQGNLDDSTNNTLVKQESIQFMIWKTDCLDGYLTSSSKGSFEDSRENRKKHAYKHMWFNK